MDLDVEMGHVMDALHEVEADLVGICQPAQYAESREAAVAHA